MLLVPVSARRIARHRKDIKLLHQKVKALKAEVQSTQQELRELHSKYENARQNRIKGWQKCSATQKAQ